MDAWVEAEIERQLQELSVEEAEEHEDGNCGEEPCVTEGSQLNGHSQVIVCGKSWIVLLHAGVHKLFY